ncbi:MAG: tetratricopeptide repeat protein [Pseudomonadota bacterium]
MASALAGLAVAAGVATGSAQVTPTEPDAQGPEIVTTEPQGNDEAAARATHLDSLFEQLGDQNNAEWPNVQNQIWAAWSQSGSDSMDLLLLRATQAMDERDLDAALTHLDDLVRLAPDFPEGWNKRATVYFLRGDYGESVADIQRTLTLEPRHFGALSGLGIILDRLGDEDGALRAYRRVAEIHPHMEAAQQAIERLAPDVDGREL